MVAPSRAGSTRAGASGGRRPRTAGASGGRAPSGRGGRPGGPVTLGKGRRPGVAIAADGTAIVVWTAGHELRFVRKPPGRAFTRAARLAAPGSKIGDDDAHLAAQPAGRTLVVYENSYRTPSGQFVSRLRAVVLSRGGRPGAPQEL